MGIRPADLPVNLSHDGDLVHRVEPEAGAGDPGQRERATRGRARRRLPPEPPADEVLAQGHDAPDGELADSSRKLSGLAADDPGAERHLDITA